MSESGRAYPVSQLLVPTITLGEHSFTPCKYLWAYEQSPNKIYLANLLNHAALALTRAEFMCLKKGSEQPHCTTSFAATELLETLLEYQFLIEEGAPDETALLKERFEVSLKEAFNFGITFGLTLKCNFRCTYCYQNPTMSRMSVSTLSRLQKHFLKRLGTFRKFGAVWFGGEPLLHIRQISSMSRFMITECDRRGVPYSADIVTNGYLLTEDVVAELERCRVTELQVTLDGTEEAHNKTRHLRNGGGTYRRIIDNLRTVGNHMQTVRIRVNVSDQREEDLLSLVDTVSGLGCKVLLYLIPVHNFVRNGAGRLDEHHYLNYKQWLSCVESVEQHALARRIQVLTTRHRAGLPYCNGYARNCLIVDPEANVYFCVGDIGIPEKRAGFLNEHGDLVLDSGSQYTGSPNPFQIAQCAECNLLPLCMGGCFNLPIEDAKENGRCMMRELFPMNLARAFELGIHDPVGSST